ncbi:MAG: tRNA lysidine(34) synthetase [Caldimicrobium sp.]
MNLYRKIKKLIGKAIFGYNLVEEGDKVLIALSGGEDSLVLTHFLSEWRHLYHRELHLYAIHLDMGFIKDEKSYAEGVNYLKTFCEEREINFIFDKTSIGEMVFEAVEKNTASPCFVCSWYRRKYFFKLAQKLNIKKIVFGHHKDDVIVTFFINMFYCGELSTILPKQEMFKGELYLIRPLYFVEKDMISRFVKQRGWRILENPCPFSGETKRAYWSKFLKENLFSKEPLIKVNLFSALFKPRLDYLPSPPKKGKT